jgi:hypothetical protein
MTLNVLTKLSLEGRAKENDIIAVTARAKTYDGRAFYRSMFSPGQFTTSKPRPKPPKDRKGIDIEAQIDTVIGFNDINLRNVTMSLRRRDDEVVSLHARGGFSEGNGILEADIQPVGPGRRLMRAESTDAGRAFRMIGFYQNMQSGNAKLEVQLGNRGLTEKTGVVVVRQFAVLGDAVITEMLQEGGKSGKRVVRERVEFDRMQVPFSIGQGQLVLGQSYVNGPLLGATMRGKLDYDKKAIFLEGTYVPLYGLNSIPNALPIIGEIFGGRQGEGLFGVGFVIEGAMGRPQLIVNPFSMLTPGILRQIFETNPAGQTVTPRAGNTSAPVKPRSSSSDRLSDDRAPSAANSKPPAYEQPVQITPRRKSQPPRNVWSND